MPSLISVAVTPGSAALAGTVLNSIAPATTTVETNEIRFIRVFLIIYFLPYGYLAYYRLMLLLM
jgi:hypothetical protein